MFWKSDAIFVAPNAAHGWGFFPHTKELHILGSYSKRHFQFNFCVTNEAANNLTNVRGNFCVYKITGCAQGKTMIPYKYFSLSRCLVLQSFLEAIHGSPNLIHW